MLTDVRIICNTDLSVNLFAGRHSLLFVRTATLYALTGLA